MDGSRTLSEIGSDASPVQQVISDRNAAIANTLADSTGPFPQAFEPEFNDPPPDLSEEKFLDLFFKDEKDCGLIVVFSFNGEERKRKALLIGNSNQITQFIFYDNLGELESADFNFDRLAIKQIAEVPKEKINDVTSLLPFIANQEILSRPNFDDIVDCFNSSQAPCLRVRINDKDTGVIFFIGEEDDKQIMFKPDEGGEVPLDLRRIITIHLEFPSDADAVWMEERLAIPIDEIEPKPTDQLPAADAEASTDKTEGKTPPVLAIKRNRTMVLGSDTIAQQVNPIKGLIERPLNKRELLSFITSKDGIIIVEFLRNNKPTYGLLTLKQEGSVEFFVRFNNENGEFCGKDLMFEDIQKVAPLKGNEAAIISLKLSTRS